MDGFEFFQPAEGGEAYDPAAFERFKDQIKKNAAFMARAKRDEQRQKIKEDRLVTLLLKFIKNNQRSAILLLAARMLQENIPASFILPIIILGNDEVAEELKKEMQTDDSALLEGPAASGPKGESSIPHAPEQAGEFSLATQFGNASLPLKIKAEVDAWGKGIWQAGSAVPFRVLETALDTGGNVKKIVIDSAANVLSDFVDDQKGPQFPYDTYFAFCEFFMQGIMKRLREQIENQKELRSA